MQLLMKRTICVTIVMIVAMIASAGAADRGVLDIKPMNGAPALYSDDQPIPPLMGSVGQPPGSVLEGGKLHYDTPGLTVQGVRSAKDVPKNVILSVDATMTRTATRGANMAFGIFDRENTDHRCVMLLWGPGDSIRLEKIDDEGRHYPIDKQWDWELHETVRMTVTIRDGEVTIAANGEEVGTFTDPEPFTPGKVRLSVYAGAGHFDNVRIETIDGDPVWSDDFEGPKASAETWQGYIPTSRTFADVGVHLYTTMAGNLQHNWRGPDEYDWSNVGRVLDDLAQKDLEGRLLARFRFEAPEWWRSRYPDEMMHVARVGSDELVPRPYVSFASELWREQANEAMRDYLRYLREHPEGWRVAGVNLGGGHALEWVYRFLPDWSPDYYDYSPAQHKGFRAFLKKKYGTDEKLRAAWKNSDVTFETADIPSPEQRRDGDFHVFFDPAKGRQLPDYFEYHVRPNAESLMHFAKVVKDATDGKMFTCAFYGYHMSSGLHSHDASGCHGYLPRVLEWPYLDCFSNPHSYRRRNAGGATVNYVPWASIRMHDKFWFDEDDTRTHLAKPGSGYGQTETAFQTANVLKRNFGHTLSLSTGIWYLDWERNWFGDEPTMETISKIRDLSEKSLAEDRRPISEIAVVISKKSQAYLRGANDLLPNLYTRQYERFIPHIGAPFDLLLVSDLADAREYKFYIFLDTFYLTDAERRTIRQTVQRNNHNVLWLFAPGFVTDEGLSNEAMSELTGIKLRALDARGELRMGFVDARHPFMRDVLPGRFPELIGKVGPLVYSEDAEARVLGTTEGIALSTESGGSAHSGMLVKPGFVTKDMGDWTSVFCGIPHLQPMILRNIARDAGVHIYSDGNEFVSANSFMVSVHARYAGERTIRLPEKHTVRDAFTGEVVAEDAGEFNVHLKRSETGFWWLE